MNSNDLVYVGFKRSLYKVDVEKQLHELIEQRIRSLPNSAEIRLHPELILLACQLVENSIRDNKKLKLDKRKLVGDALHKIFTYNAIDRKLVDETIEFLHSAGKIHKVRMVKKVGHIVWSWLKRRWL